MVPKTSTRFWPIIFYLEIVEINNEEIMKMHIGTGKVA